ncbi:hypothetical protein FQR65_LT10762 [Abscondita terminalis]|nr:hypothetical protein FQR65_LT10762 [Abscondita terminalis]
MAEVKTDVEIPINFKLIKLVAKASGSEKVDLDTIFQAVLKGNSLEVDESTLKYIYENDLMVDVSKLTNCQFKLLGEALIYYMSVWPGWQSLDEYEKGKLDYKDWFKMYQMYLMHKYNYVMKTGFMYSKTSDEYDSKGTQTDQPVPSGGKKVAPYAVTIGGPPEVLNNIVFIEDNGDILIKQHAGKPWDTLTLVEFLNWPHVSVEVKLPDLSFTRTVSHLYERYIGVKGDPMVVSDVRHIVSIKKLQSNAELQPYTYNFFECYIFQVINVLDQLSCVSKERLAELQIILMQFLKDIDEINVFNKTMSTNVCVSFHIGNSRYIRNKKMVNKGKDLKSTKHPINYYEIIYPQIDLSLNHCNAKQDLTQLETVTFESLNDLLHKNSIDNLHEDVIKMGQLIKEKCVVYSCTLCKQNFEGFDSYNLLLIHFRCVHKSEQAVLCYKCGKQFEVKELTGGRWAHNCEGPK